MSFRDLYRRLARGWGSKEKKWEARQHKAELRKLTKEEREEIHDGINDHVCGPECGAWIEDEAVCPAHGLPLPCGPCGLLP